MERDDIAGPSIIDLRYARSLVAHYVLSVERDDGTAPPLHIASPGAITLEPHQRAAAGRLHAAIREFGGGLLADPVGTGKTYVALAIADPNSVVLVVAPAVLRDMWMRAAGIAERTAHFASFESLSRGRIVKDEFDLLIVDEAHHARNPHTARFRMLSRLAWRKPVVLLSATPIHNRRNDLTAVLSLFLGERAGSMTGAELARCVIRREQLLLKKAAIPRSGELRWRSLPCNDAVPAMLLALPPPLPPRDGGDGGALVVHSLIRQWASSDAALEGALRRRLFRAEAMIAALGDGTWPSRSELSSWIFAEDSLQLGFSALLASPAAESSEMLPAIRAHRDGVSAALAMLRSGQKTDDERAKVIQEIRGQHPGRGVLAFSQYADTIAAMFRRLSRSGEVAAMSGSAARVAGGAITRAEAISRFAPVASGSTAPHHADRVSLLLTTDLLSEGVNLQDAGVVIHLDLPWTPARMEQRLGRIARIGSPHAAVYSYAIRPPASAEAMIRIRGILDEKMRAAGAVVSAFPSLLAANSSKPPGLRSEPAVTEEMHQLMERWLDGDAGRPATPVFAAVHTVDPGFVAAVEWEGATRLFACRDDSVTDDPAVVLQCLTACCGPTAHIDENAFSAVHRTLEDFLRSRSALTGIRRARQGKRPSQHEALKRISQATREAKHHDRARIVALANRARAAALDIRGNYAEEELVHLSICNDSYDTILMRMGDFSANASNREPGGNGSRSWRILVLILLSGGLR